MAAGDDLDTVLDERGDRIETVLWGTVFLFTLTLFVYEFGLGVVATSESGLLPVATIAEFERSMWLAGLIGGGGVVGLIVVTVFRYASGVRERAAPLLPGEGSFKFAVFLLAVSIVVGTTVFSGAATLAQTDEANPAEVAERQGIDREVEMSVVSGQWFWRYEVEGVPRTQAERVVVPADTIVQFQTTSSDVIHSFSIKHLGITKDSLPGQLNQGWFYVESVSGETDLEFVDENGTEQVVPADTYQVRCAELCGKGHSKMVGTVVVVSPDDYEIWVHAQGGDEAFSEPDAEIDIARAGDGDEHDDGEDGHDDSGDGEDGSGDGEDGHDDSSDGEEGSGDGDDGHDDGGDGHDVASAKADAEVGNGGGR